MRRPHINASTLALALALGLAACGDTATAPSGDATIPRTTQDARQETLERLLGRWQRTALEDDLFGEDGAILCDGPGPLDLTGSYKLLDAKRISITWPGAAPCTYAMAFMGDTLRLTLEGSSVGDGWTLTRRK